MIAAGSDVKAISIAEFKMGGFENLDEDGIEIVDAKKYPKYAEVNANRKAKGKGKRGDQVRAQYFNIQGATRTVDSNFCRLWSKSTQTGLPNA